MRLFLTFACALAVCSSACANTPGTSDGVGDEAVASTADGVDSAPESTPELGTVAPLEGGDDNTVSLEDIPEVAAHFVPIQESAGLDFVHVNGASGRKYMVETLGAGGGLFDYNGNGLLDIYLVQGGPLPGSADQAPLSDRLFRNEGNGRFTDVTEEAELNATGYGMGVCFGDVDNDGHVDIYVANFGPDQLWRNEGNGRFTDITASAGIHNSEWSSSCAFADYDRDGWLDVFVVNYVDHGFDNHKLCGPPGQPMYCHPDVYSGVPDVLYRNIGGGKFEDVTVAAGVYEDDPAQGKGLGVSWFDADGDGWIDLYVANDSTRQFLYLNQGDGSFIESGVIRGVAFNSAGRTEAGMGVAVGDANGDGHLDLYMTTLDVETNTLMINNEDGFFEDQTAIRGAGLDPENRVGFGTEMFDVDHDGDLDIFVTNGHIIDNIELLDPRLNFEQRDQLYQNQGDGTFVDVSEHAGPAFATLGVGRATALGDVDGDGDLDILVTHNARPAVLLRNDSQRLGRSILLDLRSRYGGRPAVGAHVIVHAHDRQWVSLMRAGGSYQGQSAPHVHFGLGTIDAIDELEIRWPEGDVQVIPGTAIVLDSLNRIDQRSTP